VYNTLQQTRNKRGKLKRILYLIVIFISLLTINSCTAKVPAESLEIKPAPIHQVEIRFAESYPVQVFVYIQGGLSDGCTTFKEVKTTRDNTVINIVVTVQRSLDIMCTQIYGYFEQNVALGTDFVSGKTYTVKVNDVVKTFVMP
jgi:hypothetical protein